MDRRTRLLLLSFLAFVSLGLPDTIFGVAWPSLRGGFGLPQSAMGAALVTGVSGYFVSGLVAGNLMSKIGVGGLLAGSSGLVALGLVGYALAPAWHLFFPIAFFIGLGSGAIDSALNAYAARNFSVRHMNWLHASWGLGASTGPVIMTAAIAQGAGYRAGYAVIASALGLMTLAFVTTRRMWNEPAAAAAGETAAPAPEVSPAPQAEAPVPVRGSMLAALRSPSVLLLMATYFVYTGLETTVGSWCFTLLTEGRGLGVEEAGSWTAAYWASLTLGRVALGWVVEWMGADRLLRFASAGIVLGVALFAFVPGVPGRAGLLLLGASLAPVYPTLMARTPARVGAEIAPYAVGLIVSSATLGSSLLPALVGLLVGWRGLAVISAAALVAGVAFLLLHEVVLRFARPAAATNEIAAAARNSRS
ncbi:MAG: MFS transporter [Polyangiaceae bacterium]